MAVSLNMHGKDLKRSWKVAVQLPNGQLYRYKSNTQNETNHKYLPADSQRQFTATNATWSTYPQLHRWLPTWRQTKDRHQTTTQLPAVFVPAVATGAEEISIDCLARGSLFHSGSVAHRMTSGCFLRGSNRCKSTGRKIGNVMKVFHNVPAVAS
jgi:hypothetical protein